MQAGDDLDIFANQAPQQLFRVRNHLVQAEDSRCRDLLAAERQQLLRDCCRPSPGRSDGSGQEHLAIPVDHREVIVKIVRHAARQQADAFHLLGMAQLLFQPRMLFLSPLGSRDIAIEQQPRGPPVDVHGYGRNGCPELFAVQPEVAPLHDRRRTAGRQICPAQLQALIFLGMYPFQQGMAHQVG